MWIYNQTTGEFSDAHGKILARGYSGAGNGKNNPSMQSVPNQGPLPEGHWTIGRAYHNKHTGPISMNLSPADDTSTFGRSHFLIHGDSKAHPGHASHGCIILNPTARQQIEHSGDHDLLVVRGTHAPKYPSIFPLHVRLHHLSPDAVRSMVKQHGFDRSPVRPPTGGQAGGRGDSEIWYKPAGHGYAIVRIDAQGHARAARQGSGSFVLTHSAGTHGGVPHYHKEWIEARLFQRYLQHFVPQVVRYDDAGQPVLGGMHDGTAKQTHIKR